jgi:type I restriction enzyme M protein
MITGEIRNKVDKIWTNMWADGITNPLTVIEQLTYLMFIRSLDEKELENEGIETLSEETVPKISLMMKASAGAGADSKPKTPAKSRYCRSKVFPFIKAMNGESTSAFLYVRDIYFLKQILFSF